MPTSSSSPVTTVARAPRPTSSIYNAGAPWELGLAETNQILLLNAFAERVVAPHRRPAQDRSDVAIAALLGAEEYGFATAPLVSWAVS
jgi:glutamate synthase (NADPH/NADH) large chain